MIYLPYYEDYEKLTTFVEYTKTDVYWSGENNVHWNQTKEFSLYFRPLAYDIFGNVVEYQSPGCTTIAAGQLMRYYEHPSYLPWHSMPLEGSSDETCRFLYELASVSNPIYNDDGSTAISMENMANTMKKYGYEATFVNKFDMNAVSGSCIIHSAYLRDGKVREHAWTLTGSKTYVSERFLEVWTFPSAKDFRCVDRVSMTGYPEFSPVMHYVNWGWGGSGNGWYTNIERIAPPNTQFEAMRGMIINISPRK